MEVFKNSAPILGENTILANTVFSPNIEALFSQ